MYQTLRAKCVSCENCAGLNEYERVIFERTGHASRLLDFGGGDNRLKRKFLAAGFAGRYETLDIAGDAARIISNEISAGTSNDDSGHSSSSSSKEAHEYSSLDQVRGEFDAILCLETVEHMTLNDYIDMMDAFGKLLGPRGIVVISTPNPQCVVPMWAGDPGHITQFPMADLAADFVIRGLDVEAFRVRYGAWPRGVFPRLRFFAQRVLCYLLSVDYANGLCVIGTKKA